MTQEKRFKNLTTYVICMILAMIILIIIAAMADNREQTIEHQLYEQQQQTMQIESQIVSLSEQNYSLQQELQQTKDSLLKEQQAALWYQTAMEGLLALAQNDRETASNKIKELEDTEKTEEQSQLYQQMITMIKNN